MLIFNPKIRAMHAVAVLAMCSAAAHADNGHERAVSGEGKDFFAAPHSPEPLAVAVLAMLSVAAYAHTAQERAVSPQSKKLLGPPPAAEPLTVGTIRRLEAKSGQVTIAHGPLPSLGMGTMTTAFLMRDPGMFKSIRAGQTVRFAAERVGGLYTVTQVEATSR